MIYTRSKGLKCAKCIGGKMYLENSITGSRLVCLNCGYVGADKDNGIIMPNNGYRLTTPSYMKRGIFDSNRITMVE